MSIVKSFSVGDGDMFYIKHGTDSFSIIDCCLSEHDKDEIISEIKSQASGKGVVRFISTHPDDDHIRGLVALDDAMRIPNFYCVANETTKADPTDDFERYCAFKNDPKKAFRISRGCSRKWLNQSDEERGGAGIHFPWPVTGNNHHQSALTDAAKGRSPNNISCVITYSLQGGATLLWMGDLESDFMRDIKNDLTPDSAHILFAPHHGRDTGKVPPDWLAAIDPKIVIIGEAPSKDLDFYAGYDTITQNSAGDITFECILGKVHVYASNENYSVAFLTDEHQSHNFGNYIGSFDV